MTSELFDILTRFGDRVDRVTHVEQLPARLGRTTDWPSWMDPAVRDAFVSAGIERPYEHQVETADIARAGENVIVATRTASANPGLRLCRCSMLRSAGTAAPSGRGSTTLYLSPTKALAADQLDLLRESRPQGPAPLHLRRRHAPGGP